MTASLVRGTTDGADCASCPLTKLGMAHKPVMAEGPVDADWIVIGEGPGVTEVHTGRPFQGAAGRMIDNALASIGVKRERLWVTQSILCALPPNATETVKSQARVACATRLERELAVLPGKPMVTLGAVASQGFLSDKFSITAMAGTLFEVDVDGSGPRYIIPTVHPSSILRGGAGGARAAGGAHSVDLLYVNLTYDLQKVARLASGHEVIFTDDVEIEVEDKARAEELIYAFVCEVRAGRTPFAVDTETVSDSVDFEALDTAHANLTAVGLATKDRAISIAWAAMNARSRRLVGAILGDSTLGKIMHNRVYDAPVLARHKMPVRGRIDDTMLAHHCAFPGSPHDLQRVTSQFFAVTPWKASYRAGKSAALGINAYDTDDERIVASRAALVEHLTYNARDALATARLMPVLRSMVERTKTGRVYEVDLRMAEIATRMTQVGVPVSLTVNAELHTKFKKVVEAARQRIEDAVADATVHTAFVDQLCREQGKRKRKGDSDDYMARVEKRVLEASADPPVFSINSGEHIAAYLRAKGVGMSAVTGKGKTSTAADVLEGLTHIPEVRALIEYREAKKMLSTFVGRIPHFMDARGRVHPRWSVNKITGRWGSEAPVVQNVSKGNRKKGRPNLRAQFEAPVGRILVGADYAQIEARLIALASGDPFLVDIFANGRDIHSEFARLVWPDFDTLPVDQRKELRDTIKRPEYGAFYQGSIDTLYASVVKDYPGVMLSDLRRMLDVMGRKMPGIALWHKELHRQVVTTGEIRSLINGRRRWFPTGNASPTDVSNFVPQSSGSDVMGIGLDRLVRALPTVDATAEVILQIHDAVVVECAEELAEEVKKVVRQSLMQEHEYKGVKMQFPVDVKVGRSWADL